MESFAVLLLLPVASTQNACCCFLLFAAVQQARLSPWQWAAGVAAGSCSLVLERTVFIILSATAL
jgi:hypothetical protein